MNRLRTFGGALCAAALCASAPSCASVLGVEDGILDPPVAVDAGGDVTLPVDSGPDQITVDVPNTCPTEQADDTHGIFVSLGGVGASNCGSKLQPCNKLQLGIDRAKAVPGTTTVYVDSGTYNETIQLAGGITVQGGWDDVGGVWKRQCTPTRASSVKIVGQTNYGVRAESIGARSQLDTLSIEVGVGASPGGGQSFYGIYAVGATTWLQLSDVSVTVGNAGAGNGGSPGGDGADPRANCNGTGGGAGTAGGAGSHGGLGTFGPGGYTPSGSGNGGDGSAGNGTAGGGPAVNNGATDCVNVCGLPDVASTCNNMTTPNTYLAANTVALPGSGGCGGEAGGGGSGGGGGGSSVAIYVWDAQVNVTTGIVRAGNGGAGGAGGSGGKGAQGSGGTKGNDATCVSLCVFTAGPPPACVKTGGATKTFLGGAAGPQGGTGGAGGAGGGGAGGFSYAVFQNSNAVVTLERSSLAHGSAGAGANGAPSGKAADQGTVP